MHVVCERALGGQGEAARKVVWGCQGEAWGLGPKDQIGRRLFVPNVTSQKCQNCSHSWGNTKKHWNEYKCKRRMRSICV